MKPLRDLQLDRIRSAVGQAFSLSTPAPTPKPATLACDARFEEPLKFCGECGKPMKAAKA